MWMPIGVEGLTQTMMWGDGYGVSRPDLYVTSLMDFHRNWRTRANELSETTKLFTMFGTYIRKLLRQPLLRQGDEHHAPADRGLRRRAGEYDLLLMPTTPIKATELPPPDAPRELYVERALDMISNTAPFDITHHPAMAMPCGMVDGLPVVADADRQAFRRADHLQGGLRLRAVGRLEEDVAGAADLVNPIY